MSSTSIPKARDDDPEDVSWALSTAATSLARGDRVEALKWLRRAAEAASEAERDTRALELAKAAAELSTSPGTPISPSRPPPPAPSRPPPLASRPPPPAPSRPPPPVPSSRPAPIASRPPPAVTPKAPEVKSKPATPAGKPTKAQASSKGKADETGKRVTRKSLSSEAQRARAASTSDDTQPHEITNTEVRPPMKTPAAAVVSASEADSWPTETSDPTKADNPLYGQERTRIGSPAYKPDKAKAVATQAVRVVIWRAPDGSLRVSPHGTAVSAVTMEAMLVAVEPDADLLAWLAPP